MPGERKKKSGKNGRATGAVAAAAGRELGSNCWKERGGGGQEGVTAGERERDRELERDRERDRE